MNDWFFGYIVGFGFAVVISIGFIKCTDKDIADEYGEEWEKCYPNKTCNEKLTCLKNKCVDFTFDAGVEKNESCTAEFCTLE